MSDTMERISYENFYTTIPEQIITESGNDVLVIDDGLTGVNLAGQKYLPPSMAIEYLRTPSKNGIKIHRMDCPTPPTLPRVWA